MSFGKGFKKVVDKIDSHTLHVGFQEEEFWVSSGNLALNRLLSGKYGKAMQYGKTALIGGISGSGKSLVLATCAMQAQNDDDAFVVWIDVEKASSEAWLARVGLKTDEDNMLFLQIAKIEDIKRVVADLISYYDEQQKKGKAQKVFVVVDSYSMSMTEKQMGEAEAGKTVGDQGQKAKQIKDLIVAMVHLIARRNIIIGGVVHTMESQDKYAPDEVVTGGRGAQYAADLVMVFSKLKMKNEHRKKEGLAQVEGEDEKSVVGIRSVAKVYKSRYSRPETSVEMQVVFGQGIDKYSGLFELLKDEGIITMPKSGWYTLTLNVPGCPPMGELWRKAQHIDFADVLCKYLDDNEETIVLAPITIQADADDESPEE